MRIGLIALKESMGCTSMAIHLANFLAADGFKVALCEKNRNEFATVKADFAEDGTFEINDVHYYPSIAKAEPNEDYIIDDIGKIGILYEPDTSYAKYYLCTDGSDSDMDEIESFRSENPSFRPDVILFGASKDTVRKWSAAGYKTILIGKKREAKLSQNLMMAFSLFLRTQGVIPPAYHIDKTFAPVIFGDKAYVFEELKEESDQIESTNTEPKEMTSGIGIHKTFSSLPKPQFEEKKDEAETVAVAEVEEDVPKAKDDNNTISLPDIPDDEEETDKPKKKFSLPSFNVKMPSFKGKKKTSEETDEVLNDFDSCSYLKEEPMQGVDFGFDTELPCKDISEYSLFLNKHFTCFGLKKNVRKKHYDNTDGTLLKLTAIDDTIIQFMTEDLLSGDYTLTRFSSEDIRSLKKYFSFMCTVFAREIGKTTTLREYVEFKQYYNSLCETKLMLDTEERARKERIHKLYSVYSDYAELYNVDAKSEDTLINEDINPIVYDLTYILNEHVCDESVKDVIKTLIDDIKALKPEPVKIETKVNTVEETVIDEDIAVEKASDDTPAVILNDAYKIVISCYDEDGNRVDGASYGVLNIERAVAAFLEKEAFVKRVSIKGAEKAYDVFSVKSHGATVTIPGEFNEDITAIRDRFVYLMTKFSR